jgi:hypothetical protein
MDDLPVFDDVDEFSLSYFIEFFELLFFDPVVSGSYSNDDDDSDQDGGSFVPSVFEALCGDSQDQGDDCGNAQHSQHFVFEVFNNLLLMT